MGYLKMLVVVLKNQYIISMMPKVIAIACKSFNIKK